MSDRLTGNEKLVVLFTAETQDGKPFYVYIYLTLKKLARFERESRANEHMDLTTLGDIVAKGWGHEPPKDVHQKIADEYGEVRKVPEFLGS